MRYEGGVLRTDFSRVLAAKKAQLNWQGETRATELELVEPSR